MPEESGLSILKQAAEKCPACFCVIVTAHSSAQNVREALGAGAKGFVVKPYSAQKVRDVITKYERMAAAA